MYLSLSPSSHQSSTGEDDSNQIDPSVNLFDNLSPHLPESQGLPHGSSSAGGMAVANSRVCRSSIDCVVGADCMNLVGNKMECFCIDMGVPCLNVNSACHGGCGNKAYCTMDRGCVCHATDEPQVDGQCHLNKEECHDNSDCLEGATCMTVFGGSKKCLCNETRTYCLNRYEMEKLKAAKNGTVVTDPSVSKATGARVGRLTTEVTTTKGSGAIHKAGIEHIINSTSTNKTFGGLGRGSKFHEGFNGGSGGQSVLLTVVLPLGVLFFIGILIVIICLRRHRQHRLGPKRGSEAMVKSADGVMLLDRMNNISKNPHYFASADGDDNEGSQRKFLVREICMDHIVLVDVVGEGAFGQVYRGEMHCPDSNTQQLVAVKVLKENVSHEIREDFEREVEIMSAFDHDNILKLIGVVTQNAGQSPYMIFEYMVHGDLAELLRKNDPSAISKETGVIRLQKADMVDIATQIANGMRYLTSQHFVHRDLATRNCLVGEGLVVKISDFGMSRDIYTCDYYKIGGSRMLPVRWMSPESMKYGKFTSESDAWAYGVVLWEIFSLGRQPYYGHSNEEVVRFLDAGILLQRPEDCPSTIYHIMLGCWKADPKERLSFEKIHKHLQDYHGRLVKMAAASQPTTPVANDDEIETKFPTVASSPEFSGKPPTSPLQTKPLLKATQSDPQSGGHGKVVTAAPRGGEGARRSSSHGQSDLQDSDDLPFQVTLPPLNLPAVSPQSCPEDQPGAEEVTALTTGVSVSTPPVKSNGHESLIKLHAMDSGFSSGEQHWTMPEVEPPSSSTTNTTTTPATMATGMTSTSLTDTPSDVILEPLTSVVCANPAEMV